MRKLVITCLMLSVLVPAGQAATFEVGRPVPTLALPAADDGRQISVLDFKGKKVVLHVFASW